MKAVWLLAAFGLAGCGSMSRSTTDEAQLVVNRKLTGMPVGDFIERYGPPRVREEALDGTLSFNWQSGVGTVAPGPLGLDERVCALRVTADKAGRIVAAQIRTDSVGRASLSRCSEVFA